MSDQWLLGKTITNVERTNEGEFLRLDFHDGSAVQFSGQGYDGMWRTVEGEWLQPPVPQGAQPPYTLLLDGTNVAQWGCGICGASIVERKKRNAIDNRRLHTEWHQQLGTTS